MWLVIHAVYRAGRPFDPQNHRFSDPMQPEAAIYGQASAASG